MCVMRASVRHIMLKRVPKRGNARDNLRGN